MSDDALFLAAEDLGQVDAGDGDEGAAVLLGLDGEAGVVGGDEDVPQVGVGGGDVGDAVERQFLDQPVLANLSCSVWKARSERPRAWGE